MTTSVELDYALQRIEVTDPEHNVQLVLTRDELVKILSTNDRLRRWLQNIIESIDREKGT